MRTIFSKKKSIDELFPVLLELTEESSEIYKKYSSMTSLQEIQKEINKLAQKGNKLAKQNEKLMETPEMKTLLSNIKKLSLHRDKLMFENNFSVLKEDATALLSKKDDPIKNSQDYVVELDQTSIELKKLFQYPESIYQPKKEEIISLIKKLDKKATQLLA